MAPHDEELCEEEEEGPRFSFVPLPNPPRRRANVLRASRPVVSVAVPPEYFYAAVEAKAVVDEASAVSAKMRWAALNQDKKGIKDAETEALRDSLKHGWGGADGTDGTGQLLPVVLGAAGVGGPGGTPSLLERPTLSGSAVITPMSGLAHTRALSPTHRDEPDCPSMAYQSEPTSARRKVLIGGSLPRLILPGLVVDDPNGSGEKVSFGAPVGEALVGEPKGPKEGTPPDGGSSSSGCLPGTGTGMGEGVSALFVHPDEDVYYLGDAGGILAEPPRAFEALAFASGKTRGERMQSGMSMLGSFAGAAALGAHRVPPRMVLGDGTSEAVTWQSWTSDNLTSAIGVPLLSDLETGDDGAPADTPSEELARGAKPKAANQVEAQRAKKKAEEAKAAVVNAAFAAGPQVRTVAEIKAEEGYRKMHIYYGGVVPSHAPKSRDSRRPASPTPSDDGELASAKDDSLRRGASGPTKGAPLAKGAKKR